MAKITVYQFLYFDRAAGAYRRAPDYATEKAIKSLGGQVLQETAREVDESAIVQPAGLLRQSGGAGG